MRCSFLIVAIAAVLSCNMAYAQVRGTGGAAGNTATLGSAGASAGGTPSGGNLGIGTGADSEPGGVQSPVVGVPSPGLVDVGAGARVPGPPLAAEVRATDAELEAGVSPGVLYGAGGRIGADAIPRLDDRVPAPVSPDAAQARIGSDAERWRLLQHGGRWWYWTPQNTWMYHDGIEWRNHMPRIQAGFRGPVDPWTNQRYYRPEWVAPEYRSPYGAVFYGQQFGGAGYFGSPGSGASEGAGIGATYGGHRRAAIGAGVGGGVGGR